MTDAWPSRTVFAFVSPQPSQPPVFPPLILWLQWTRTNQTNQMWSSTPAFSFWLLRYVLLQHSCYSPGFLEPQYVYGILVFHPFTMPKVILFSYFGSAWTPVSALAQSLRTFIQNVSFRCPASALALFNRPLLLQYIRPTFASYALYQPIVLKQQ